MWGAVFDRTKDGKISQRNFGGHEYPRLAHVGDRTGLEMIRTLQQEVVALQQEDAREHGDPEAMIKVFAETTITEVLLDGGRVAGAFGYFRDTGRFVLFETPAIVLATGGIGKAYKVTSNSWEYTGDGHALALRAGATLLNMEFVQLHPTGMVWPPSVRGILVTESVRGDGGVLRNSDGKRFMFDYVPDVFRKQYAETEEEADRWYTDPDNNRRPPELLPRDEVARSINSEVKAGRGTPHGGVFLDVSSRLPAEEILRRLPSMYHQFKELADVDITKEPMEVGPTCHYVMGGVEVDPDTGAASVPGLFAAGEVSGGMHGSNRLGGNSLSDLLVFGRRAGLGAAEYASALPSRPVVPEASLAAATAAALAPLARTTGESPYAIHGELQNLMTDLVGLIRRESELKTALVELDKLRARAAQVSAPGGRAYNPGWHLALDLRNMLLIADCVAQAALERQESRGGHTRDDYPSMSPEWRKVNLICALGSGGTVGLRRQPMPAMRPDLLELFELSELKKYMTDEELVGLAAEEMH
jgi:succinate dehydrogenase / fumarate reductase flavoprotein subunit